jgi:glycosyltransferase involved in cell wall biosynthesis
MEFNLQNLKLSFLIAAHNEAKTISAALENLLKLPYENYEVLIGLDGCTDNTEELVKAFCSQAFKFKYYTFNIRQGKSVIINNLAKQALGDIFIIHDADWLFRVKAAQDLQKMLAFFADSRIGGIAESFPLHYIPENLNNMSFLELGVIWSTYAWMDYIKSNYTRISAELLMLDGAKMKFPLPVNILRKELYQDNSSLADDFERCLDILNSGCEVVVLGDENLPRMVSYKENISLAGLMRQKQRTALAREQLSRKYKRNFNLDAGFYLFLLKFMSRLKFKDLTGLGLWILIFVLGTVKSKFSLSKSTKDGWKLRQAR